MILRNWYNAFKSSVTSTVIPQGLTSVTGNKVSSGYYSSSYSADSAFKFQTSEVDLSSSYRDRYIVVGSGTTPPTLDDYRLESKITSGLTGQLLFSHDGSGIRYVNLTNSSSAPITISEIGHCAGLYNSNNAPNTTTCLVERSTFDPITIQPGEIAQIEYKIDVSIPE